jgi:hypothetical protein
MSASQQSFPVKNFFTLENCSIIFDLTGSIYESPLPTELLNEILNYIKGSLSASFNHIIIKGSFDFEEIKQIISALPAHIIKLDVKLFHDYTDKELNEIFSSIPRTIQEINAADWSDEHGPIEDKKLTKVLTRLPKTVDTLHVPINEISYLSSDFMKFSRTVKMNEFESEYLPYEKKEVAFTALSLGMYAYLRNCVGLHSELSFSTILKIAVAVLAPPVAMMVGMASFFWRPTYVRELNQNNNANSKGNILENIK